jgi:SAM-dependent methyltransferase
VAEVSYRDSHKYAGKGAEYEQYYQTQGWERFLWSREQEIILRILDKYLAGRDIHLLDFACGTGRITGLLENSVKTSTGVDVSGSMLAIAGEKLKRTEIIEADITAENVLKPRKFNLVTAFRFFLNAEPNLRLAAIGTLSELLADDGYFVFNNHHNISSPWMSMNDMKNLAEAAGLEIIEIYPVGFFHPPKIPVPYRLNRAIDNIACRFKFLSKFSESPIVVCRRRESHNGGVPVSRE